MRIKKLNSSVFKAFYKELLKKCGEREAKEIWRGADERYSKFQKAYADLDADSKMMILPAAALYEELQMRVSNQESLEMLKKYGKHIGEKIGKAVYCFTSIPGVSKLLWKNMSKLMRKTSSPEKGYVRNIVSETNELVGVDILACPLHNAALKIGIAEIATIACCMDKAYMSFFKYINYTRTMSVAEGGKCCDYRLSFDKNKK